MKRARINWEISIHYNDNFHAMTNDELKKFFGSPVCRWGVYDEKQHAVVSVTWTKPGFLNLLTDAKSVVGGAEMRMKHNLQNYRREASVTTEIAGITAKGIRYSYTVNGADTVQKGEMLGFRMKNKFYVIQYLSCSEDNAENHKQYESMLQSVAVL